MLARRPDLDIEDLVPILRLDAQPLEPSGAGTTTLRDTSDLVWLAPWAQVVAIENDSLMLEGALDRIEDARLTPGGISDTTQRWLPVPPAGAHIAYTIWGRAPVTPTAAGMPAGSSAAGLTWAPNPFRVGTRLRGRPGDEVTLFDTTGRRVRRLRCAADGAALWDGCDDAGRRLPAGLYLACARTGAIARVVRIE